jgi:hypothetical protein
MIVVEAVYKVVYLLAENTLALQEIFNHMHTGQQQIFFHIIAQLIAIADFAL